MCSNESELKEIAENGLKLSPVTQCLIERSIAGYKEIEYEVMRDVMIMPLLYVTWKTLTLLEFIQVTRLYLRQLRRFQILKIKCYVMPV